jgi:glycosyltransferase involved in cell wall biosynthesis
MRVLVDALSVHFGGGLTFATEQLGALRRVRPDIELEVLVAPWNRDTLGPALTRFGATTEEVVLGSLATRWFWQEREIPRRVSEFDLFYAPGNFLPLRPLSAPTVLCQQNPNYAPDARGLPHNRALDRRLRIAQCDRSLRQATRVVTVAHWLLASLAEVVPSLRHKGVALHSGVPTWETDAVRPDLEGLDEPFFLVLANDAAHKDLDVVVRGWGAARRADSATPAILLAGEVSPDRVEHHRALVDPESRRDLHHVGAVRERAHVKWLLERAEAMVSAARLEALTLTILEARSVGCPLVLAETPSHLEEAADVARFFPVGSADALAGALLDPPRRPQPALVWSTWDDHAAALGRVFDAAAEQR